MSAPEVKRSSLLQAYRLIEELEAQLQRAQQQGREPIALIGMGCRIPGGANSPEQFWQLLRDGVHAICPIPPTRWDVAGHYDADPEVSGKSYVREGGFLEEVDGFDADFFGISPREAVGLDPQQRLLLEVAWEALEHAGISPASLVGSRTGVYVGVMTNDYERLQVGTEQPPDLEMYQGTGTGNSFPAGRLSYAFGLQGPSMVVATACSSSLVTTHLACQALRAGECDLALSAGVNLMLSPDVNIVLSRMRAVAADGRCKTFDASADGYGRGEGCGLVVLKRLSDALTDGDRVLAVIRGSAVNHDGASGGLTIPNGPAQKRLLQQAFADAGIRPADIDYIEAHGTGTSLGDPIEIRAIEEFIAADPERRSKLWVASLKTNIGHLEAAAGVAGLIKVVLALQYRQIPPHLHLRQLNPHIQLERLEIPLALASWTKGSGPRVAGVSSFGISGVNAHVVVAEAPEAQHPTSRQRDTHLEHSCHLFVLSARTRAALVQLADRYAHHLAAHPHLTPQDVCASAAVGRSHFHCRLAICFDSRTELESRLIRWVAGEWIDGVREAIATDGKTASPDFVFSTLRASGARLAESLSDAFAAFRGVIGRCEAAARTLWGASWRVPPANEAPRSPAAALSIQYAWAMLWRAWGIEPRALVAGQGDLLAAACAALVMQPEDALRLIHSREFDPASLEGAVRAVHLSDPAVTLRLEPRGEDLSKVCLQPEYWIQSLQRREQDPKQQLLGASDREPRVEIPPTGDAHDGWRAMLRTLSTCYLLGASINWEAVFPRGSYSRVPLPTYAFQRSRYWIDGLTRTRASGARRAAGSAHPLLGVRLDLALPQTTWFESRVNANSPAFLRAHRVFQTVVFPAVGYVEMALSAGGEIWKTGANEWRDVVFEQALLLGTAADMVVQTIAEKGGHDDAVLRVSSRDITRQHSTWTLHASGKLCRLEQAAAMPVADLAGLRLRIGEPVSTEELYQRLTNRGIDYGDAFRAVELLWRNGDEVLGRIRLPDDSSADIESYHVHPILLDACLQLGSALLPDGPPWEPFLPVGMDRVRSDRRVLTRAWAHVKRRADSSGEVGKLARADISLLDDDGRIVVQIDGLAARRVGREDLLTVADPWDDWLYRVAWMPQASSGPLPPPAFLTRPTILAQSMASAIPQLSDQWQLAAYEPAMAGFDRLSLQYLITAWLAMGWRAARGARRTATQVREELGIVGAYHGLTLRWLSVLAQEGFLHRVGDEWEVLRVLEAGDPQQTLQHLTARFPSAGAELRLLERCGSQLDEVLRGTRDPLPLLFADDGDAASIYSSTPSAQVMNGIVQRVVSLALRDLPQGRRIRLLEIGAGTGGTTSGLLPLLPENETTFAFTDISASLVRRARQALGAPSFVRFEVLDIERDPEMQGFAPGAHDVVIAANVLHATKDLQESLHHARQLLAPHGLLVLLEVTAPRPRLDLTFGLTDGWWRFEDVALRSSYPLLSRDRWHHLLQDVGFEDVAALSPKLGSADVLCEHVFVAQLPATDSSTRATTRLGGRWLVCEDDDKAGQELAALLEADGAQVTRTRATSAESGLGVNHCHGELSLPSALGRRFDESCAGPFRGIVHLGTSQASLPGDDGMGYLEGCRSALYLLQALLKRNLETPPRLYFVTRGAQAIDGQVEERGLPQWPLAGIIRSLAWEHPELRSVQIDLDPDRRAGDTTELLAEICSESSEDHVAFRDGVRYVARLVRADHGPARANGAAKRCRRDGTYLIAGGLGGLGLVVARWMAEQGAGNLILLSRQPASTQVEQTLGVLRRIGTQVVVFQADVSRRAELSRVIRIAGTQLPPLRGVIHAAGVLDDGTLEQLTWDRFLHVMAPKVAGAWNLHEVTRGCPLDFFILFSSAAAQLGSPGQSNHAAANAFMDGLAHFRRSRGLPATSINWGAWSEVGAAAARGAEQRMRARGIGMIAPHEGLAVLERLMSDLPVQVMVDPIDWPVFSVQAGRSSLLTEFVQRYRGSGDQVRGAFRQRLEAAPFVERRPMLEAFVRSRVAHALGRPVNAPIDAEQGFFELGMDSLTSVELRNGLQESLACHLPATLTLKYPNLKSLVGFLASDVMSLEGSINTRGPEPRENLASHLAQLDEQQVDALKAAQVAKLKLLLQKLEP
jgi:microcystin synthetase protein McyD